MLAGACCAVAAGSAEGRSGALSALLGTVVVAGFFASGIVPLLVIRGQESRTGLALGFLLLNYTFRLAAVVVLLTVAAASSAFSTRWLGITVIACALTWSGAMAGTAARTGRVAEPSAQGPRHL